MKVRVGEFDDGAGLILETETLADQELLTRLLKKLGQYETLEHYRYGPGVTIVQPILCQALKPRP